MEHVFDQTDVSVTLDMWENSVKRNANVMETATVPMIWVLLIVSSA